MNDVTVLCTKSGGFLNFEIPLQQFEKSKLALYIIFLYEFDFVPKETKCLISADINNKRQTFKITLDYNNQMFERTFDTFVYRVPSAYFVDDLNDFGGFDILETSDTSWEVSKK